MSIPRTNQAGCGRWAILYADLSVFTSEDGAPEDAPPFGVVAIPQADPDRGRNIMHGWKHYYWNDGEGNAAMWWGCDTEGLLDRLHHRLPVRALLLGRTVSNDRWQQIIEAANGYYRELLR